MLIQYQVYPQQRTPIPAPLISRPPPVQNLPFQDLAIDLPMHKYQTTKVILYPFDARISNNGKFDSLYEAMLYIGKHCMQHHGVFTKQLAKRYLNQARILNGPTSTYIILNNIGKKEFDTAFKQVRKEMDINVKPK